MNVELPKISSTASSSMMYAGIPGTQNVMSPVYDPGAMVMGVAQPWGNLNIYNPPVAIPEDWQQQFQKMARRVKDPEVELEMKPKGEVKLKQEKIVADVVKPSMRIVKIIIADTTESVPLDKRILFRGDEQVTDLNDEELFFEIPIVQLLKDHNEYRITITEKKNVADPEKARKLEPIRIRDLKMMVVNVAAF